MFRSAVTLSWTCCTSCLNAAMLPNLISNHLSTSRFFSRKRGSTEESDYRSNSRKLSANRLFRGRSVFGKLAVWLKEPLPVVSRTRDRLGIRNSGRIEKNRFSVFLFCFFCFFFHDFQNFLVLKVYRHRLHLQDKGKTKLWLSNNSQSPSSLTNFSLISVIWSISECPSIGTLRIFL